MSERCCHEKIVGRYSKNEKKTITQHNIISSSQTQKLFNQLPPSAIPSHEVFIHLFFQSFKAILAGVIIGFLSTAINSRHHRSSSYSSNCGKEHYDDITTMPTVSPDLLTPTEHYYYQQLLNDRRRQPRHRVVIFVCSVWSHRHPHTVLLILISTMIMNDNTNATNSSSIATPLTQSAKEG